LIKRKKILVIEKWNRGLKFSTFVIYSGEGHINIWYTTYFILH